MIVNPYSHILWWSRVYTDRGIRVAPTGSGFKFESVSGIKRLAGWRIFHFQDASQIPDEMLAGLSGGRAAVPGLIDRHYVVGAGKDQIRIKNALIFAGDNSCVRFVSHGGGYHSIHRWEKPVSSAISDIPSDILEYVDRHGGELMNWLKSGVHIGDFSWMVNHVLVSDHEEDFALAYARANKIPAIGYPVRGGRFVQFL